MEKIIFENYPSTETPISATNLNKVQENAETSINEAKMKLLEVGFNIDTIKESGNYGIYNATGTLPPEFTTENNIFIECFKWDNNWGRQFLYDIRLNSGIYTRILTNGEWSNWIRINTI